MAFAVAASSMAALSLIQGAAAVNGSAKVYGAAGNSSPITRAAFRSGISHSNSLSAVPSSKRMQQRVVTSSVATENPLLADDDSEDIGEMGLGQRELKDYPPGLLRYETMAVLRPDISDEQRLALTQRYEETIIAGGGLDVEMFNRGMQPLAYNIKMKNMQGVSSRYLDGIYLLFTYVTKPESQLALQKRLTADDDIIRSTTFKLKV